MLDNDATDDNDAERRRLATRRFAGRRTRLRWFGGGDTLVRITSLALLSGCLAIVMFGGPGGATIVAEATALNDSTGAMVLEAEREIADPTIEPGETTWVTIEFTLDEPGDPSLHDELTPAPDSLELADGDPTPTIADVTDDQREVFALWTDVTTASLTYEVSVPVDAEPESTVQFNGSIETAADSEWIEGDTALTVDDGAGDGDDGDDGAGDGDDGDDGADAGDGGDDGADDDGDDGADDDGDDGAGDDGDDGTGDDGDVGADDEGGANDGIDDDVSADWGDEPDADAVTSDDTTDMLDPNDASPADSEDDPLVGVSFGGSLLAVSILMGLYLAIRFRRG